MNNVIPDFNIEEIKKIKPGIFDCTTYQQAYEVAVILFSKKCVKADPNNRRIIIKDAISLTMSLSANETKIYFDSYICEEPKDHNPKNAYFRTFAIEETVQYLVFKAKECQLIRSIEG